MYGEHDRTHGHGLNARPRGRMPYSDSWLRPPDPPRSAGPATLPEPDGQWQEEAPAPHRTARHRKDEEAGDDAVRSPARRSWTYLDSRPFSMPPPPSPWRRPWSRLSRDQLLGPALVAGFLVAAGVGVWSSGWSPWAGTPTASTVPAPPAERLLADHDMVFTPPRAPAAAGAEASGEERKTSAGKGRAAGRRKAPRRDPVRVMPAERALSGPAGRSGNEWVKRVERHRESGEGRGSARTGTRSGEAGNAAPVTGSTGRGAGNAAGGAAGTRGNAGSAASGRSRSGVRKARSQPRTARTGAPDARSPSPSASRSRPSDPSAGGGSAAGISAAYACRHLPSGDWRYAYCVQVWNDYKSRNGLP
ncbi:hypothetical protein ABZ260_24150 [Streptosporangium sp. NPDC006013]|uniref:hypothetical protein n=1 Tax=Streptosporangium sp. NPDC006013 TaxID=3155596 RepID=UPI0033B52444